MRTKTVSPTQQPCKTCRKYINGYCLALQEDVESWWTGCARWRA